MTVGVAAACPKCKVAAGDLAGADSGSDVTGLDDARPTLSLFGQPVSVSLGADVTTAYFYRGYLQQDRGLIVQPYLTLSTTFETDSGWKVQPYLGWWNSLHDQAIDAPRGGHGRHNHNPRTEQREVTINDPGHAGNLNPHTHTYTADVFFPGTAGTGKGWYEAQLMAGVTLIRGDWWLDLSYQPHFFPANTHDFVQELGGKLSYDVAGFWDSKPSAQRSLSVRPHLTVFRELSDDNGDENTYVEVGIEPTWRFRVFGQRAALSLPIVAAGSPDGFYYSNDGNDETFGYASAALRASLALPIPRKYGDWYLNGSLTYLQLVADSVQEGNRGDSEELIGTIGIGVSF